MQFHNDDFHDTEVRLAMVPHKQIQNFVTKSYFVKSFHSIALQKNDFWCSTKTFYCCDISQLLASFLSGLVSSP